MARPRKNQIGEEYGNWTVIGQEWVEMGSQGKKVKRLICRCKCGYERSFVRGNFVAGDVKQCKCQKIVPERDAKTVRSAAAKMPYSPKGQSFGWITPGYNRSKESDYEKGLRAAQGYALSAGGHRW